jgi:hypothetical protein
MRLRTIRRFAAIGVLMAGCSVDAQLGTEAVHHDAPTVGSADSAVSGATDSGQIAPRATTGGVGACAGNECAGQSGAGGCARTACNEGGGAGGYVGAGGNVTRGKDGSSTGGARSGGATSDAASPARDASTRPSPCKFTVDVDTITARGPYAPDNTAAIWVQTFAGKFVKTLLLDGTIRANALVHWIAVSNLNKVDAVTGATRLAQGPLTATWNCTDTSEAEVPDGSYAVCVTFAEGCIDQPVCTSSPMDCLVVEKGAAAATFRGQDTANFSNFVVTYR